MESIFLTQKEFDELLEYSTSVPTGTAVGKIWKRGVYVFKQNGKVYNAGYLPHGCELIEKKWFHCQYVKSEKLEHVDIKLKEIVVAGPMEIDKAIQRFNERSPKIL